MDLKQLSIPMEIKQVSDTGGFEGYASTRAMDHIGDIVEEGAFKDSLESWQSKGKWPKMLWQHDPNKVIGVWTDMQENDKGLYVKGEVATDTTLGGDLYKLMRRGAIDAMSIGYQIVDADYDSAGSRIRRLRKLKLWEVSLVTFPMNPEAEVTAVKRLHSVGDVERVLRDAGVPNNFAKLVANHGFTEAKQRLDDRRDGGEQLEQDDIDRLLEAIRS